MNNSKPSKKSWKLSVPTLRFSPYAWAKLLFMRDLADTEVGGFGISHCDDLLLIVDVQLVKQTCTSVSVEFADGSVADFFDRHVDAGLRPEQFARVWIHTHPANCARPSSTDESTVARVFGGSDWAAMFILAQQGDCCARLQFNVGPGTSQELDIEIDYSLSFAATDWNVWEEEFHANVTPQQWLEPRRWEESSDALAMESPASWHDAWHRYTDDQFMEISANERF